MDARSPLAVGEQGVGGNSNVVALLALAVTGCAIGFPDGRRPVGDVRVPGSETLDEDDIADGLANHPPRGIVFREVAPYEELALELDRRRIESFYRTRGFFSVKVREPEVVYLDPEDPETKVIVSYTVEEGPPSRVVDVKIVSTSTAIASEKLSEVSTIRIGERFSYDDYQATKDAIDNRLDQLGHPRGEIEGQIEVDRDRREVRIVVTADPGPLVRFDAVTFEESAIPKSAAENRIAWARGDVYDPNRVRLTEGRLYTLGLVGSVRFTPTFHDDDTKVDLAIGFSESAKNELRLGGGVSVDPLNFAISGRATYVRRDFFHPLMSFHADLRPQILLPISNAELGYRIEASAKIIRDDFLFPRLQLSTGVNYRLVAYEAFSTNGPTLQAILGRPFGDEDRLQASVSLNAALLRLSFDDVPEGDRDTFGLKNPLPLVYAVPSISYDGRDNPLSPHRGFLLSMPVELGKVFGAPNTVYLKMTPEAQGYLPIFTPRIVVATRVRLGTNLLDKPLPITQRYFSGGSDSVRGFGRRRMSPGIVVDVSDATEDPDLQYFPLGGEALFVANLELRFEIFRVFGEWFGLVGFLDAGDAQNAFGDLEFAKPHLATGAGLRYHTPVGPLRFDVGYRLNRFTAGEPDPPATRGGRIVYHISIGEAF